jgi:hypothetical protein
MRRLSLFSAVAALLLAAPLVTPASAGQLNSAPTRQTATSNGFAKHGSASGLSLNNNMIDQSNFRGGGSPGFGQTNSAPTVSTALSTALSVGGADGSPNGINPTITPGDGISRKPTVQLNSAPAVQAGVAVGVAIDGNANARATNSNGGGQDSGAR